MSEPREAISIEAAPAQGIRVAIVAEHASTRFGGEAMLPLQYFRILLRRGVDACLVVHSRTREELSALFSADCDRIAFVPDTWLHRILWRTGGFLPHRINVCTTAWLMHLLTQAIQRRIVRRLVRERNVNLVHEPIPVSPRMPSLLHRVGAPVIIGPMNGGMAYPPGFLYLESRWERWFIALGNWLSGFLNFLIPGKRKAAMLLVANDRTRRALSPGVCCDVTQLVENGVDLELWHRSQPWPPRNDQQMRLAYMGRLIDWKGIDLLLDAVAMATESVPVRLEILGDGPERARLETLASRLHLQDRVVFHGYLPQQHCRDLLVQCDALVLPSLYECGGAVVLEAMALEMPVIATNWGGPADYLDASTGILIEPTSREAMVTQIADAIIRLHRDPEAARRMGVAAREKVERCFSWESKIDRIIEIYKSCLRPH